MHFTKALTPGRNGTNVTRPILVAASRLLLILLLSGCWKVTLKNDDPAPHASSRTLLAWEDTPLTFVPPATDIEGAPLSFRVVSPPQHGTVVFNGEQGTYRPAPDYHGVDGFSYVANDGNRDSGVATILITVAPVDDPPTVQPRSFSLDEDSPQSISLSGADVDSLSLVVTVVSPPVHGTLTGSGPSWVYTPGPDFHGTDSFTYTAGDGVHSAEPATVTLVVRPVNDAPVASGLVLDGAEDTTLPIVLAGTDVDGDPLDYVVVSPPLHGTLVGTGASQSYMPAPNYHGSDRFTFKVRDGSLESAVQTVSIDVLPVNDPPQALAAQVSVRRDTPAFIMLTGADIDSRSLAFRIVDRPTHGSLAGNGANWIYTPDRGYVGSDSFTFTVRDGLSDSLPATVSLHVDAFADGSPDVSFRPAPYDAVRRLALLRGGKILIAGSFGERVARLSADGSQDIFFRTSTFGADPDSSGDGGVLALAVQADGKMLVGGDFVTYGGMPSRKLVRLNPDGSLDRTFAIGSGFDKAVRDIAVQPDGKIVVVGDFEAFAGSSRKGIARLNGDGSLDTSFLPGTGFEIADGADTSAGVSCVTVAPDGNLYVGGRFRSYDGRGVPPVVRLSAYGALDIDFDVRGNVHERHRGSSAYAVINKILIQPDGRILIGGDFTRADIGGLFGPPVNLTRVHADGSRDTSFAPTGYFSAAGYPEAYRAFPYVSDIALQSDGKIIAVGAFSAVSGAPRQSIVRMNADGSVDPWFNAAGGGFEYPLPGPPSADFSQVYAVAVEASGRIVAGGSFRSYRGFSFGGIARLGW